MENEKIDIEVIDLGTASASTHGHGTAYIEPIGLMPKTGISND